MIHDQAATIRQLHTGVPGLDEVLGGGLPEFSFNLLAGAPGSGKTTLAHQIMFALASPERPALYFTALGEPPMKMLRYQQQFAFFDLDKLNRCVRFVSLSGEAASGSFDVVLQRVLEEVQASSPGLVFIDSFRSVLLAGQGSGAAGESVQRFIQNLGVLMSSWQATTFLLGEYHSETESNPIFGVADGLIWLRQRVLGNSIVRKMEVMKMRGQPTVAGLHTFRISKSGVRVFAPPALSAAPLQPPQPPQISPGQRMGTGVPGLDAMMGGGLPRGYSLLVSGPSGSGKSLLASAFLLEGARLGETGVIAAFEQRAATARGLAIADLIASDRIGMIDTSAADLSVDEIATLLIAEIHRLKASRVVIDSLSGFELALAPTFRAAFRESLSRMLWALASTGVTVLMISELEDRFNQLSFSPYDTAFLTDAIIVQRYVEVESRLQRVMAVVKVRASAHSNALRLFTIDDDGIQLGDMLPLQQGLLSGRPLQRPRRDGLAEVAHDG